MTEVVEPHDPCVEKLARLTGDRCKAKTAARKLQNLTDKIDESELAVEAEVFKAMSDPFRLAILKLLRVVSLPSLRWSGHRDDEPCRAFDGKLKVS